MKNFLIIIVIIMAVLLAAAVTNPTRDEFISWGINEIRSEADNEFERVFGGAIAGPMLELQTEAQDYVFFTVFTVEKSDSQLKYLGIFNKFYSID